MVRKKGNHPVQLDILSNGSDKISLTKFAEKAYLDYAISVVKGRAIPDLCDGLKPVQRRILFAMNRMFLNSTSKPVKSARVVGDVLGKFHPHGDQSAYEALVRLAQDFNMKYPLIDGHGNFGSRDGDSAAAMRYTEARLSKFSDLLMSELDEGTVQFSPNYDGSFLEPVRFPAKLPICLLNGSSGIAVGMATEIPSHNLKEISSGLLELISNPNLSNSDLYEIIKGPDFSSGAKIISSNKDIENIYNTGKGTLRIQARWKIENFARSQWQIVFYELPNGISSQKILEELYEITDPKVKSNKKTLTNDQAQSRQSMLNFLGSIRDESGKDDLVRLVIEPKNSKVNKEEFVNLLFFRTSLQTTFSVNLVAIGIDSKPKLFSLREILEHWLEFRILTIKLRSEFRLQKIQDRLHILNGRKIVLMQIENVIKIIKDYDDPKPTLIKKFQLSVEQVDDILEIRLRQLAKMEIERIKNEIFEKLKIEKKLKSILKNKLSLKRKVHEEIVAETKKYGDDRKTLIEESTMASIQTQILDEPATVVVSINGWVRYKLFHGHQVEDFTFKASDLMLDLFECRTTDYIVGLSNKGRSFSVPVSNLPSGKGTGLPFNSFIDLQNGESIKCFMSTNEDSDVLVITKNGQGFRTKFGSMITRNKAGKSFVNHNPNDHAKFILTLQEVNEGLAIITNLGFLLIFGTNQIKTLLSGGKGVNLINLNPGDFITSSCVVPEKGLVFNAINSKGSKKTIKFTRNDLSSYISNRGRRGKKITSKFKFIKINYL